jgi:hypothetical protein
MSDAINALIAENSDLRRRIGAIEARETMSRTAPEVAWSVTISAFQNIQGLRGLWTMANVDDSGDILDVSGHNSTLTNASVSLQRASGNDRRHYGVFDGTASSDQLSAADSAIFDILGTESYFGANMRGLTMGGWFRPLDLQSGNIFLSCKWGSSATNRSYSLYHNSDDAIFGVHDTSDTLFTVTSTGTFAVGAFRFVVGRFDPSTEIAVFVDGAKTTNTTSIPASLKNSTAGISLGARDDGNNNFDGQIGICFLAASLLPDAVVTSLYEVSRGHYLY